MRIPTDTDGPGVDPCTEVIPPDMVLTIDVNYRVITLILEKMVIYPSVWRIMYYSHYPQFLPRDLGS